MRWREDEDVVARQPDESVIDRLDSEAEVAQFLAAMRDITAQHSS